MSRILDWLRVPTVVDVNGPDRDRPYRASCPEGDWRSDRWVSTARAAREQQLRHWASSHYRFDGSPDGGWGSGWGTGWE